MNKKRILIACLACLVVLGLVTIGIVYFLRSSNYPSNNGENLTNRNISYPISNPVINSTSTVNSYPVTSTSLLSYIHSSGVFGFDYPNNWEFLPERKEMGLRPKEYNCTSACFNEIVTVLYIKGKGDNLRAQAVEFDGGYDSDWRDVTVNNLSGLFYNFKSDNLDNEIYWFSNGIDAVKVMFRKYNRYATDGHTDNSRFENDFKTILNSFHFIE